MHTPKMSLGAKAQSLIARNTRKDTVTTRHDQTTCPSVLASNRGSGICIHGNQHINYGFKRNTYSVDTEVNGLDKIVWRQGDDLPIKISQMPGNLQPAR
jgi:hypothetical protein